MTSAYSSSNIISSAYTSSTIILQGGSGLPTCCEQRVTYRVIGISDLELESTFLEQVRVSVSPQHELLLSSEASCAIRKYEARL
jgi:hypothetical protein